MTNKKKKNKSFWFWLVVFFIIYSSTVPLWIVAGGKYQQMIFNWPDANANYFFAQLFASEGRLFLHEPLNMLTDNLLHTRSINVVNGNLVPISFLPAIVIFGLGIKFLGTMKVLFLTPIMATVSGWLVYRLMREIFKDHELAWLTAILFLTLAPWIYFANVVMLPTVMFIFLLLAGWLAIVKSFQKDKYNAWWILGSLLLSLAVVVRPTEIIWLALISLAVLYINRSKLNVQRYVWSAVIFGLIFSCFLFLNKATYGGFLSLGYFNLQSGGVSPELAGAGGPTLWGTIKLFLFPFGFDLWLIIKNFYKYIFEIVTLQFILAVAGAVLLIHKKKMDLVWRKYLLLTPFVFLLILLYYGSWSLADPLVLELNRISSSYVRYFMPLYIWMLPLTAWALIKVFKESKNKKLYYLILGFIIVISFKIAFYAEHDGLVKNRQILNGYYNQYHRVKGHIPEDSIIITDRTDKVFFPKYKVIVPQGDLPLWERVAEISVGRNIYYYTDKSDEELVIDQKAANQVNLILTDPVSIKSNYYDFRLFKVINE